MTASIITFPLDRCRQPGTGVAAAERAALAEAVAAWNSAGWRSPASVAAMMWLGLEGVDPVISAAARAWLRIECNVSVVRDDEREAGNAR